MSRAKVQRPEKQQLIDLYRDKSLSEIARQFDVSQPTVRGWMKSYNVHLRNQKQTSTLINKKLKGGKHKIATAAQQKLNDKQWLYQKYVTESMSTTVIGKLLGISETPVNRALEYHSIDRFDHRRNGQIQVLDQMAKLRALYDKGLTIEQIAKQIKSSSATVQRYMDYYDIARRPSNSYQRKHVAVSKQCQQIIDNIRQYYDKQIIINDRRVLNGRELDIYCPEDNFAIEFNGLYSHVYRPEQLLPCRQKGPDYHLSKTVQCLNKQIRLFHVFEDEYTSNSQLIDSMIRYRLHAVDNKVFARKCIVKQIDTGTKNIFLDFNHIQQRCRSKVKLGLFNDCHLVACMTFRVPRFSNHTWELVRFAVKQQLVVPGGFQKLFQYFINNYCANGDTIVSYSDRRYSEGDVYRHNQFVHTHTNCPNYDYVTPDFRHRINRMSLQKRKLQQLTGIDKATESELAQLIGLRRIFNCGTHTYQFTVAF